MTGRLLPRESLTASQRADMFRLLDAHFIGVNPAQFDADLRAKTHAVLIERDGILLGFSTLLVEETTVGSEQLTVIHSGDTIISPEAWGSAAFPRAWIRAVYQLRQEVGSPMNRLIWLLLTSGFRTYRFLPVFFSEFYPTFQHPTPEPWQSLLQALATSKFGCCFNPHTGLVHFPHPQELRGPLQAAPANRLKDPHVQFFLSQNPGHGRGDELVCIADISPANLTQAGRRVVFGPNR